MTWSYDFFLGVLRIGRSMEAGGAQSFWEKAADLWERQELNIKN